MTQGKNILILYPTDLNGFVRRFDPFLPHFGKVKLVNYADLVYGLGAAAAEEAITRAVRLDRPDILICCPFSTDFQLSPEFFAALRSSVKVVFWFADDSTYFDSYCKYYAQAADAVITADHLAVHAYRRLGIPAVLCQEIVVPNAITPPAKARDIDVCFVGDMRKKGRRDYIAHLEANGLKPVVYGAGSANGYLAPDKIYDVQSRSKVVLNFSQLADPDWINGDEPILNRVRQNTGRPREIAIAGSFCLTERSPAIGEMFEVGREIDVFSGKEELLQKVRYYLANPDKREAMAAAAHARAMRDYTPEAYAKTTAQALAAALADKDLANPADLPVFLSGAFKAKAVNCLAFTMFSLLRRGNFSGAAGMAGRLFGYGPAAFLRGFAGGALRALALLGGRLGSR